MEKDFPQNFVFLSVLGYKVNPYDVLSTSSSPLLSWKWDDQRHYTNVHWGCQMFTSPKRSFWCTEFCFKRGAQQEEYVPGAYLNIDKCTSSYKYFFETWAKEHNFRSFKEYEIYPQFNTENYFKQNIDKNTVAFYKGGRLVKMIAELCNAKESINIERFTDINITNYVPVKNNKMCKIHKTYSTFCPKEKVNFYMTHCDKWLPKYMELSHQVLPNSYSQHWKSDNNDEIEEGEIRDCEIQETKSLNPLYENEELCNSEIEEGEITEWEIQQEEIKKSGEEEVSHSDCNKNWKTEEVTDKIEDLNFQAQTTTDNDVLYLMDMDNTLDYER